MVPVVGGGAIETSFVRAARAVDFQSETAVSLSPPLLPVAPDVSHGLQICDVSPLWPCQLQRCVCLTSLMFQCRI